jgi:hypothetical protein
VSELLGHGRPTWVALIAVSIVASVVTLDVMLVRESNARPSIQPSATGPTGPKVEIATESVRSGDEASHFREGSSSWSLYKNSQYGYQIRYPPDWAVVPAEPASSSEIAFGPKSNLRPLILIGVVDRSDFQRQKELTLVDTEILTKRKRTIAGLSALEVEYVPFKSARETLLLFDKGQWGFLIHVYQGTEGEDVGSVFEQMLSTFHFQHD